MQSFLLHPHRWAVIVGSALACLTLLVYWPACGNDLICYDDGPYLRNNSQVQAGLTAESMAWAFTSIGGGNWHPLTWLSLQLDVTLFGPGPFGFHLTNVLLHTASTVLLYAFLLWATGAIWRSAVVAALFALHPLHVESVAWAAERKDVLSGLFWMLTLLAYVWYVQRPSWLRYAAVIGAFAFGLSAKAMLVTLPCVLLLLDYWPLRRPARWSSLVVEKLPLFALTVALSLVTWLAQRGAMTNLEDHGLLPRLANALLSYLTYLEQTVAPVSLVVYYPFDLSVGRAIVASLLLASVTALAFRWAKAYPYFAVGWLWYLGTLVPVIGVIQVGLQAHADRYTYIPLIGIFVLSVWAIAEFAARRKWPAAPLATASIAVLLACAFGTRRQLAYWQNTVTLFEHALAVTGPNLVCLTNLGAGMEERDEPAAALLLYLDAARFNPEDDLLMLSIARLLEKQGKRAEALPYHQQAVVLRPLDADARFSLAACLHRNGRVEQALEQFQEALRLATRSGDSGFVAKIHFNIGTILARQKKPEQAIGHLEKAVALDPNHGRAYFNLGLARKEQGDVEQALACLRRAVALESGSVPFRVALAATLSKAGRADEAARHYEEACRATSYNAPELLEALAGAEAAGGRFELAAGNVEKALQIAEKAGKRDLASSLRQRLSEYRAKKGHGSNGGGTP
jgi:tetratricopeptide (TPR) repeat protein